MTDYDRIRVLLLDDKPEFLTRRIPGRTGKRVPVPQILSSAGAERPLHELKDCFELRWLANASEAREFRDLSVVLGCKHPRDLGREAWVPDIICFDYALTGNPRSVADRELTDEWIERISPLPAIRRLAESIQVPIPPPGAVPDTGTAKNDDNLGCFAGGLIFAAFSDHPCAPVALTRKGDEKTVNTEAGFFEWMLEGQSGGAFAAKGRPAPQWKALLSEGVGTLRKRIVQLAEGNLITISLDDLLRLAEDGAHSVLTIRSRYGTRRFPTAGLFVDVEEEERHDVASTWARDLLEQALAGMTLPDDAYASTLSDLQRGKDLADELWKWYDNEQLVEKRLQLSSIVQSIKEKTRGLEPLGEDEEELIQSFDVDLEKELAGRHSECGANCLDIRTSGYTDRQRRWAALMLTMRVVHRRWQAGRAWQRHARKHGWDAVTPEAMLSDVDKGDVYLALFPVATGPVVLPWHQGQDPVALWKTLKRLAGGQLALSIPDILNGKDWDPDGTDRPGGGTYGFLPGERLLLQWYCTSLYGDDGWETDPQAKRILEGESDDGRE